VKFSTLVFVIVCICLVGWAIAVWLLTGNITQDLYEVTK
jgi:hypothetical protein